MIYNERNWQTFQFFARRQWVEVPVYAVSVGMYPIRSATRVQASPVPLRLRAVMRVTTRTIRSR
jgi:hypothetical protein